LDFAISYSRLKASRTSHIPYAFPWPVAQCPIDDVIRTNELQVWFMSEHLVDAPLVKAD